MTRSARRATAQAEQTGETGAEQREARGLRDGSGSWLLRHGGDRHQAVPNRIGEAKLRVYAGVERRSAGGTSGVAGPVAARVAPPPPPPVPSSPPPPPPPKPPVPPG